MQISGRRLNLTSKVAPCHGSVKKGLKKTVTRQVRASLKRKLMKEKSE